MTAQRRMLVLVGVLSLTVLLVGSVGYVALIEARRQYRNWQAVRLNPLGLATFPAEPINRRGNERLIVFFGDSRAAEWPTPTGPDGFVYANRGIGGQTSEQVRLRFDQHIAPLAADLLVVQVGINDLTALPVLPEQQATIVARVGDNLREIVAKARANGTTVILTTIFPTGDVPITRWPVWSEAVPQAVAEVNQQIRAMAAPGVIIFDAETMLSQHGALLPDYARDTLHLNSAGYQALNQQLVRLLEGLEQP